MTTNGLYNETEYVIQFLLFTLTAFHSVPATFLVYKLHVRVESYFLREFRIAKQTLEGTFPGVSSNVVC